MQADMPDFKKYFPNCAAAQVEMPMKRLEPDPCRAQSSAPASVDSSSGADKELFTGALSPPMPEPSNEQVAIGTSVAPIGPSNRGLIWFCVLGWLAAGIGFTLWLFR